MGAASFGLTSAFPGPSFAASLKDEAAKNASIKPISGSWFEFNHPGGKEGVNWDGDLTIKFLKSAKQGWNILSS